MQLGPVRTPSINILVGHACIMLCFGCSWKEKIKECKKERKSDIRNYNFIKCICVISPYIFIAFSFSWFKGYVNKIHGGTYSGFVSTFQTFLCLKQLTRYKTSGLRNWVLIIWHICQFITSNNKYRSQIYI